MVDRGFDPLDQGLTNGPERELEKVAPPTDPEIPEISDPSLIIATERPRDVGKAGGAAREPL